jgi:O-antigen/teichoic acid export membrane protein
MTEDKIKLKSIKGAKWIIIMFSLAMPLTYMLQVILGRLGPEFLGTYSTIQVFLQSLVTFVVFGGTAVLSNFIPKANSNDSIARFVYTYFLILVISMIIFFITLYCFPSLIKSLFDRDISKLFFGFIILFSFVHLVSHFIQNVLNGFIEIKLFSILLRLPTLGSVIVLSFVVVFFNEYFKENYFILILISLLIPEVLALIIGAYSVLKRLTLKKNIRLYLPNGFWAFSFTIYAGKFFVYAFANVEKLFVLKLGGVRELGLFQAVVSIWSLIDLFPQLLLNVFVPMFSSYIAQNDKTNIKKSYMFIEKYSILLGVSSALFIICFSKHLLSAFGKNYMDNYKWLLVLGTASSFATLSYINLPLMLSTERNKENILNGTLRLSVQIIFTFAFIGTLNIMGIVIAKAISIVIAQIIPIYVVCKKLPYDIKISPKYFMGIAVVALCSIMFYMLKLDNFIYCMLLFAISFITFIVSADFHLNDFKYLLKMAFKRRY